MHKIHLKVFSLFPLNVEYDRHVNKTQSSIPVIEDDGDDCVDHHGKEGADRQDPSL